MKGTAKSSMVLPELVHQVGTFSESTDTVTQVKMQFDHSNTHTQTYFYTGASTAVHCIIHFWVARSTEHPSGPVDELLGCSFCLRACPPRHGKFQNWDVLKNSEPKVLKVIIVKWLQMIVPKPPGPVPMLKNWHWPPPPVPFLMNCYMKCYQKLSTIS